MLIDDISSEWYRIRRDCWRRFSIPEFHFRFLPLQSLCLLRSGLKESTQRLEKPHDLRFTENIGEYLEIRAKLREALKVHQELSLVCIVRVVRHHGSVDAPKNLDYVLVLQYFHQMDDLVLRVVAFLSPLDPLVKRQHVFLDQGLESLGVTSLLPASLDLIKIILINRGSDVCEGEDESFKIHSIQTSNLQFPIGDISFFRKTAGNITVLRRSGWTHFLGKPCVPFEK